MDKALWQGFSRSAERFSQRPALVVDGRTYTYEQLYESASSIAATLRKHLEAPNPKITAVFAYRSQTAFSGVLGALMAGNAYMPLNPTFPIDRTRTMLERSGARSMVVDSGSLSQLEGLLRDLRTSILIVLPDLETADHVRDRFAGHTLLARKDLESASRWKEPVVEDEDIAYLLFTSGSTGIPKGVMVAHRNAIAFVNCMANRFEINENDRMSNMIEMTFDPSVFDMFVCWERGACLCCPSHKMLIKPGKFIGDARLTVWSAVPSTAILMMRWGALKPGQYPLLRASIFQGEPLPVSVAAAWTAAAPNSVLENHYGPTEATVNTTYYRFDAARTPDEAELGIVPIGYPTPGTKLLVVDEFLKEIEPGEIGELLIGGPQVSLGYWRDPEKTAAAFVVPPGKNEVYYRTGDRVRRPRAEGPLPHLGRIDFQIKIMGRRVELGEIEEAVRQASGFAGVVAVGWPPTSTGYAGVEAFVEGQAASKEIETFRSGVSTKVPEYMVPRRFHFLSALPRNVNGKFDRNAMMKLLKEGL